MLDIEIVGHITDTLALTSLSNRATLDKIKTRLNGATHQQFALAAITVLRDQSRRIAELEHELGETTDNADDLVADLNVLAVEIEELKRELKQLKEPQRSKPSKPQLPTERS